MVYPDLANYHPKPDFEIRYLNKKAPNRSKNSPAADAEGDADPDRPVPLALDASTSVKSICSASTLSAVSVADIAAVNNEDPNPA